MKIVELPISFEFNDQQNVIYPSLIVSENELALVDTGYPCFLPMMEAEIRRNGFDMENVRHVIITHYDDDHIGALFELKEKYPRIRVIASETEAKSISGEQKSERLVQAEQMLELMPEEQKEFGTWFIRRLQQLMHVPVDHTVRDGDMLFDGQCRVVATPGHTSGHISLYFPELRSVITGDAAVHENGGLAIANPHYCLDLQRAEQSLNALQRLDADTYYCFHGGRWSASGLR